MIGWERRVLLRHYLEQGMKKTELAERFGISRQTVHRWIREGELDRDLNVETVQYGPRPSVPTKLDPYKGIILSRLGEYPELTAVRLFAEIKAAGYCGGYTQVKAYVRMVRPRPPGHPKSPWWFSATEALRVAGSSGSGRLRRLPVAVGQALRTPSGSRLLAPTVAALLPSETRRVAC